MQRSEERVSGKGSSKSKGPRTEMAQSIPGTERPGRL